jgi:DNA-directed RNA polymerase I, II, and III subunit RPABC1
MNAALRLFKARKTIYEMFRDRGYTKNVPLHEKSVEHFMGWLQQHDQKALTLTFSKGEKHAMVFFPEAEKVGVAYIRDMFDAMASINACTVGVIVYVDSITPFAKQEIRKLCAQYSIDMQSFKRLHLQFNLTRHTKVPPHTILSKEEKDQLLMRYNVPLEKLPYLPLSDPIAQYYGAKKGQVMQVQRTSPEGHPYYIYRCVTRKLLKK